jgi:hypothetical protein
MVQSDEWRIGESGGIITLVRICCEHHHAVERDLISLGFNGLEDLGTPRLTLWKLNSIVWGSPPGSAVYHAETRQGTYSQTDQILAGLRGGGTPEPPHVTYKVDELAALPTWTPPGRKNPFALDAMPVDELRNLREQKRAELLAKLGRSET